MPPKLASFNTLAVAEASVTPDKYVSLESLKVVSADWVPSISTNMAPVRVLPASLIDVIYSADSLANKSVDEEATEKPLAVPLALSTILDSIAPGGFAKANPAV